MSTLQLTPIGIIDQAALNFLKTKSRQIGFSYLDVWLYEHAVSFSVAKMMDADMLATVHKAVESAIEHGTSFADFKKTLKPYLMSQGWWGEKIMLDPVDGKPKLVQLGSTRRLRTIYQTNIATAYAAGQWQRIQTNKERLPYLRYNPSAAHHPREAHKRYYNLVLPVDHPLWNQIYPPNGYGCLCTVSQLTKKQAERFGISEEPDIPYTEVTNPRTGQVVKVPADITPTFAHNHGDRLGALDKLFGDKHGEEALLKLKQEREHWLEERYRVPVDKVQIVALPETVSQKRIDALMKAGSNNIKFHEAQAAAQLEKAMGVRFEVYDLPTPKGKRPADYLIVDKTKPREQWTSIDFMFTEDPDNEKSIFNLNKYFFNPEEQWKRKIENIEKHLKKSDMVPLDLRHLNALNRAKLLDYVLSLPKEQQDKIMLLVGESK